MSNDEKETTRKQLETASGSQAKSIGRKIKDLDTVSWDKASSDVMRDLLLESFSQNSEALHKLLSTGNATLTHTQDKGKWGTEFPRILMEVREELRNAQTAKLSEIPTQFTETPTVPKENPFNITDVSEDNRQLCAKDTEITIDHIETPTDQDMDDYQFGEVTIVTTTGARIQMTPKAGYQDLNKVVKTEGIVALIGLNYLLEEYLKNNPSEINKFAASTLSESAKYVYGNKYDPEKDGFKSDYAGYINAVTDLTKLDKSTEQRIRELEDYASQVGLTEALPKVEEVKQAVEETKQIQDKYVYTFDDGLEVKLDFELNDQQKSALKELEAFVNGDDTSITLSGYAGTGKTTIMGIFNEYLKRRIQADIIFSAPTHRANAVTRQKTPNAKVVTLQSLLGLRPDFDITEDVFDLHKLKFEQVADVKIEAASIVIVDEASMIQDSLYDFLLEQIAAKGAQIIFMGDKGQLRPVKANNISKVFRNDGAQLQLTKVERTGDNPILKESTRVRNGEGFSYETDIAPNGQGVEYSSDKTRIREFVRTSLKEMKDSQDPLYFRVLAATNASVDAYNSAIRQILYGRRPAQLYEGELVMGYSNREYDSLRKKYKLMNSGDYVVRKVEPTTIHIELAYPDKKENINMEGYKVTLKDAIDTSASSFTIDVVSNFETDENIIKVQEYIQTLWSMRKQLLASGNPTAARSVIEKINNIQNRIHTMRDIKDANGRLKLRKSFDYGYAHTIHKSQGGTYSKVLINDSSINTFGFNDKNGQEVRQELKYVAVSRAKNYVMVQTLEKAKQQVVEDYDLDEEFVSATTADLKQAANDSTTEELDKMGKQRKKECE